MDGKEDTSTSTVMRQQVLEKNVAIQKLQGASDRGP